MTARPVTQAASAGSAVYVSTNARPRSAAPGWQPAILTVLAAGAASVAAAGDLHSPHLTVRLLCAAGTAAFIVISTAAVLRAAAWLGAVTADRLGATHASVVRIITVIAGVAATVLTTLGLLAVPVGQLLLGGALTGALLGIAGQQTLANLVAGTVLLFTRTIAVGDRIRLYNGTLGGSFEGTVTELGLIHLHLRTAKEPLAIPNTQVLTSAIAILDPQAAQPANPLLRPRRSIPARRRHRPPAHTTVLRTTRILPAVTPTTTTPTPD
jgi:small-conductance mechanosensitive channel